MMGVVIIANPTNTDFSWTVLLPVIAAIIYSIMVMMTRKLGMQDTAGTMSFYIQFSLVLSSAVVGLLIGHGRYDIFDQVALDFLLRAWHWPTSAAFLLIAVCGGAAAMGGYLLSQSYRLAEASLIAPFEYASLPLTIVVGFVIWGDLPDSREYLGSALIILSGLAVAYFDAHKHRQSTARATSQ